jgi:putative endonuclease
MLTPTAALGKRGEDMAHRYLQRAGFHVVARNYKPGEDSEVDIVARRGELLVFVEVKTRESDEHAAPERAVGDEKERHILRAARTFVTRSGIEWERIRFDIISIVMTRPPSIAHYEDAFAAH